ncbi:hypothetical protein HPP92_018317 [Vanilla planifolia]|uniref:Receptor kinase-like protein Xa21 n=1 Tax=Vanilla planifolia TaxID=51239 RepID=A0A835QG59_VANPL|nr:hypothetical protein HPP92_018317 [Vanilla planifolia]
MALLSWLCSLLVSHFHVSMFFGLAFTSAIRNGSTSDEQVLLSFKSLISYDPQGALASWDNRSLHFCLWKGVTCRNQLGKPRVTSLDLESLDLGGSLPASLGNLSFLQRLHLPQNHFQGGIPEELGSLSNLQHLNLSFNSLHGSIPDSLSQCSLLQNISMANNTLSGFIPSNLSRSLSLQILDLTNNQLGGTIPASLGALKDLVELRLGNNMLESKQDRDWDFFSSLPNCSNLRVIDISRNMLGGVLPISLANLSSDLQQILISWNQISGSILQGIEKLVNLRYLDTTSNILTGTIPSAIGSLDRLETMRLRRNKISGTIPSSIGNLSSLTILSFAENQLEGGIPPCLGNLTSLGLLSVAENNLDGDIPPSMGSLLGLKQILFAENHLSGNIPDTLGNIPSLVILELGFNLLSGLIPSSIWNLSTLEYLDLEQNKLVGSLPAEFGVMLPRLTHILLYNNKLHGLIPTSLSNISALQTFDVGSNEFSGKVPASLGNLKNLSTLDVSDNNIEAFESTDWEFMTALINCTNLKSLHLGFNDLSGTLPSSITNLSATLSDLTLGNSKISGNIPMELGNLKGLTILVLSNNRLTNTIPHSIGSLKLLHILYLNSNELSGEIPTTLGNLTRMNRLYLQFNKLTGQIPLSLRNCKEIVLMVLAHNMLTGHIPKEIFTLSSISIELDLSYNFLTGHIPFEVGNLVNLQILALSNNKLTGEIPTSFSKCVELQILFLGNNFFYGTIPASLSTLRGLDMLDLSQNNFSGKIPEFLESLPLLYYFNLSFNHFEGEVPRGNVFDNVSALSLVGNDKLCGGIPELNLPPCPDIATRKTNHSRSRILVLSATCSIVSIMLLLFLFCLRKMSSKSKSTRGHAQEESMKTSYAQLLKATNGFSIENLIGSGSFGSVYIGNMNYAKHEVVAVKVLNLKRHGALRSFEAECRVLRNIRHRNLVKILTSCSSIDHEGNDFKALVFELIPNGSLEKWLHHHDRTRSLTLVERMNIAIDVACALDYLHYHVSVPIVHCDLKPSNVLLDNDLVAHVSDFGLAKFITITTDSSELSTGSGTLKGTIGYAAPEYGVGNKVSIHGDIYSYGMLLLEMFTGKRPTDEIFGGSSNLPDYVKMALSNGIMHVVDPELIPQEHDVNAEDCCAQIDYKRRLEMECIKSVFEVGLSCCSVLPTSRMQLGEVASKLQAIKNVFLRSFSL